MSQMVEFDLAQILEKINQKLETLSESQIRLEAEMKNLKAGQDAINNKLNVQNTWQLGLITGLVIGVLGLVAAVGKVVFFYNP